jgi:N-glycosylase/DNA lyase
MPNVEKYTIKPSNFDLELTLTCGQTFCWHRTEGELYGEGSKKFYTFRNQEPIIVEEKEGNKLLIESKCSKNEVKKALGLDKDLENIFSGFPEDDKLEKAKKEFWGLRIIQDDFFPCLISYLCSPQMRIPRIKKMHNQIARKWGETVELNGQCLLRFPTREELSQSSEEELREIGIGYRAKYIAETLNIMEEDGFDTSQLNEMNHQEAREHLKQLYGVGNKVADCVLLFSQRHHQATPLDTWAKKALEAHYPELHSEDYEKTAKKIKQRFGENSGYALEYIFHAARKDVIEV